MRRTAAIASIAAIACLLAALPARATEATGELIVSATVRAFTPVQVVPSSARAIVAGPLPGGRIHAGTVGPLPCLTLGPLAPGRYRLHSLETRISTFTARLRFLLPEPDDGYRVPGERRLGGFQLYRVLVPRAAEFEVEVLPGQRSVLGHIDVTRRPRRTWGVQVLRVTPANAAQTCQAAGSSAAGNGTTSMSRAVPSDGT